MKIQYASDLHLEFAQNYSFLHRDRLISKADILILAGDITLFYKNHDKEKYFDFLSESFKEVYWLPGNHEYYGSDVIRYHKFHEKKIRPNIHVVKNQVVSVNDVNLIFSTLWGNISTKNELILINQVSDFSRIKFDGEKFRPEHFNKLHEE